MRRKRADFRKVVIGDKEGFEFLGEVFGFEKPEYWRPTRRGECTPRGFCERCLKLYRLSSCFEARCQECGSLLITNRPCPYVGCPHSLWSCIDDNSGSITPYRSILPWEMHPDQSCLLDAIDRPSQHNEDYPKNYDNSVDKTLVEVGELLAESKQSISGQCNNALAHFKRGAHWEGFKNAKKSPGNDHTSDSAHLGYRGDDGENGGVTHR